MQSPQTFSHAPGAAPGALLPLADVGHPRHAEWQARLPRAQAEWPRWTIRATGERLWQVETRPGHAYSVQWDGVRAWTCTCPDYRNTYLGECKHTLGVALWLAQPEQAVQSNQTHQINSTEVSQMENKQVLEQLGQPFSVAALEWKVGARNREKTRGIALAYVDSRDYIARLNAVLALGWEDAYTFMVVGTRIVCKCELRLHLDGGESIARTGDGDCELEDPNATTVASAQAFKRACVKFGLGAYLYALPQEWVELQNEKYIPDAVQETLRAAYERWLTTGQWSLNGNGNGRYVAPAPVAAAPAAKPAPAPVAANATGPGAFTVNFGDFRGQNIAQIYAQDPAYVRWLAEKANFQPLRTAAQAFLAMQTG